MEPTSPNLHTKETCGINKNRKRLRESEECEHTIEKPPQTRFTISSTAVENCFTNAAFSSTPKKLLAARRRQPKQQPLKSHHNVNSYFTNAGLEVKSIANIVKDVSQQTPGMTTKNPYEVLRKPPKKKKREAEVCFENPALNLELPEKQFNPYEVVRMPLVSQHQCFVNAALNLRSQDTPASRNPYEIRRIAKEPEVAVSAAVINAAGVENLALEEGAAKPTKVEIGLPFTPTLGCRIDFNNISLSQLTPSKLLAEKLVFSPVPGPKRSLDSISEQSSALDIGKELDRYQLELENSINEAKLRRNGIIDISVKAHELQEPPKQSIAADQKLPFSQKLAEIAEGEEEEEAELEQLNRESSTAKVLESEKRHEVKESQGTIHFKKPDEKLQGSRPGRIIKDAREKEDAIHSSDSEDDELELQSQPSRFVRAYRRADAIDAHRSGSKEAQIFNLQQPSIPSRETTSEGHKKSPNVKNIIRKSIRKLIHPLRNHSTNTKAEAESQRTQESEKQETTAGHFMNSIRHSLRRKTTKPLLIDEHQAEISIIDGSERTMKFKATAPHMEYTRISRPTNETPSTLRSSLRQTRQQFMRSIFHKNHEEYAFCQ